MSPPRRTLSCLAQLRSNPVCTAILLLASSRQRNTIELAWGRLESRKLYASRHLSGTSFPCELPVRPAAIGRMRLPSFGRPAERLRTPICLRRGVQDSFLLFRLLGYGLLLRGRAACLLVCTRHPAPNRAGLRCSWLGPGFPLSPFPAEGFHASPCMLTSTRRFPHQPFNDVVERELSCLIKAHVHMSTNGVKMLEACHSGTVSRAQSKSKPMTLVALRRLCRA